MDLRAVLQFALLGLGVGGVYAVSAVGIVAIHRGSRTINFAHGGIALWGALVFYWLRDDQGMAAGLAAVLTLLGAAVFGAAVYLLVIRIIRHRTQLSRMVATLGLLGALIGLAHSVFGSAQRVPDTSFPSSGVDVFGQTIPSERIIIFALAVVVVLALSAWSAWARLPLMTRAMAEHESAAQALGASPHMLGSLNWALGSVLAAASGILVAPIVGQFDTAMMTVMAFALAAALLGRFDSYLLALAGGIALGVGESVVTHLVAEHVPSQFQLGWPQTVPFVAVMAILTLRRDRASNRLPAVPAAPVAAGLFRPIPVGLALAGMIVVLLVGDARQNLRVAAENAGHTDGRLPAPAHAAVERFRLTEDLPRLPTELPMAKRRVVGIVRALAANPAVLLLDEPGAGLSITEIGELAANLRDLAHEEGLAVLVVDHDMALVMSACDRIVVLHQGRVLADGTPEEVRADPAVREAYLGEATETVVAAPDTVLSEAAAIPD